MKQHWGSLSLAGAAVALAGCTDVQDAGPAGPRADPGPSFALTQNEVCEVIDFEEFAHGDEIETVELPGFGLTISFTGWRFASSAALGQPEGPARIRAFDTDGFNHVDGPYEDTDLMWRGAGWMGTMPRCPGCELLGRIAVIEDRSGFRPWGDERWGGEIRMSGFTGGSYYVKRLTFVDNDRNEPPIGLWVDGAIVGQSSSLGDGSVEVVEIAAPHDLADAVAFVRMGTPAVDIITGSGGIDNIQICRLEQPSGDHGCTPGFWRNHPHRWVGFSPTQPIGDVFSPAQPYHQETLMAGIRFGGGPGVDGAKRILLRASVAALLNAAHPEVPYPRTVAEVIAAVNDALASNDRATMLALAGALDDDNNIGCPIGR